jgi:hypothetical protein
MKDFILLLYACIKSLILWYGWSFVKEKQANHLDHGNYGHKAFSFIKRSAFILNVGLRFKNCLLIVLGLLIKPGLTSSQSNLFYL